MDPTSIIVFKRLPYSCSKSTFLLAHRGSSENGPNLPRNVLLSHLHISCTYCRTGFLWIVPQPSANVDMAPILQQDSEPGSCLLRALQCYEEACLSQSALCKFRAWEGSNKVLCLLRSVVSGSNELAGPSSWTCCSSVRVGSSSANRASSGGLGTSTR